MKLQAMYSQTYALRGQKVMLDFELAALYDVATRELKVALSRNRDRFPANSLLVLTKKEVELLISQNIVPYKSFGYSSDHYAFTEEGADILTIILKSKKALQLALDRLQIEKDNSEKLLLNILPAEVVEELKIKGKSDVKLFNDVTVLYTDFKDFTSFAEKVSPQALVAELDTCFNAFDEITSKYNIEKIKTIGDAYLAVCGLPLVEKNHAGNIVNAAIEVRDFMLARRKEIGNKTFEVRIGVHSGSVVAGIIGVKKFSYDIWGDTVNTAQRMEQNSEGGKINISETTYKLVKDKFNCT